MAGIGNTFIAGDTFNFPIHVRAVWVEGAISDFTGWTGRSQIRKRDYRLIADLAFSWVDAKNGLALLTFFGATDGWPIGPAILDVEFTTVGQQVQSTQPYEIQIMKGVTDAP